MPSLSASLFYKEIDRLQPIWFDKVFQFDKFNSLCRGFVRLGRYSDLKNQSGAYELQKGSGRKWTVERDLDQLRQFSEDPFDGHEVIRIVGKNPFLWHDHWPVKDYAKIFECLVLVDEIAREADKVVSKIRQVGIEMRGKAESSGHGIDLDGSSSEPVPYVAVHMRIEIDWMIHCKKLEQRLNVSQICSSKQEIMERVGNIVNLKTPTVVYLAVADSLLEDSSILTGWKQGLLPFEKKTLGVHEIYKKQPYLIQSAIDYEVCLKADIFVGNSFSTFSSLIALERTQKMIRMGVTTSCGTDVRWPTYAYNILGESKGPHRWMTNMSDSSLKAISYGRKRLEESPHSVAYKTIKELNSDVGPLLAGMRNLTSCSSNFLHICMRGGVRGFSTMPGFSYRQVSWAIETMLQECEKTEENSQAWNGTPPNLLVHRVYGQGYAATVECFSDP
ncbi:O-fucosyltransferase 23 [Turnera subulata]|uniref:O-fucosyltransferase family protein n=1 Tax=Turnera subulata TaxID=218843 RepID=A0A9Q0FAW5_9ROSI|nr:O-fucosyltransferase 23 [Turnera subulata]